MRPDFLADLMPTTIPTKKAPSRNLPPTSSGPMDADQRPENVTWAGLKSIVDVLHKTADAFGPLKSAFDELSRCVDLFEHEAKAREDYRELRDELDQLFRNLLLSFGGSVPPSMTPVISSLAQ
ncbi:hypothetical protein FRC06_007624 [Ceratobasidium sp. 370]|nr:hypothetical protein FRC06_007624 [Ceratobasidium sp. 370]